MVGKPRYIAPEVLGDDGYDLKYDIWSAGVTAYTLMAGYHPFEADHDVEVYQQIVDGYFDFKGPEWETVSDQAKDFVSKLLTYKDEERPTAEEALSHPWITGDNSGVPFAAAEPQIVWSAEPAVKSKDDFVSGREGGFDDHYDLGELLGGGEFGAVYKCTHKETGNERAAKIMEKAEMDKWEYDAVIEEFQILTSIDNPNVIRVYCFYETDEKFYIVQELAKGGELFDELEKHGRLSEKDVLT
ncbi:MAP kinase-activated protein kinase 2 (Fragment) [Seminavis robusta]|uniref:non-specific serine/threonine protein kinase n=1 Tax=Seminavis robusta TaxID=568900 RepID=A0A9N8HV43_9STRA